jgi:CelD/BcsL family acetyltransferase involved in cellulose biosynthesis
MYVFLSISQGLQRRNVIIVLLQSQYENVRLKIGYMNCTIGEDCLTNLKIYWKDSGQDLHWPSVFVLPAWLEVWWQVFAEGSEMFLRTVRQGEKIIGIAPLRLKESTALFIGNTDVCDYLDFILAPGHEEEFYGALLDDLKKNDIRRLDLKLVRPDATVLTSLVALARSRRYEVTTTREDISLEMDLPATWEEYLATLSTKQRHEVRRKLRRLSEAGQITYRVIEDSRSVPATMDTFFKMFIESRQDKANFMTTQMESFFRHLADAMAEIGLLRLGILELDNRPVAEIMCFDYNNCVYLYNSGYDPEYMPLSAGLLSKVLAIKDSIEKGKSRFDFLKGAEVYKNHLGGREVPLYRCQISIT